MGVGAARRVADNVIQSYFLVPRWYKQELREKCWRFITYICFHTWDEFGPKVTFVIPSSGGDLSLYSVLDSDIVGVSVNSNEKCLSFTANRFNCVLRAWGCSHSQESQQSWKITRIDPYQQHWEALLCGCLPGLLKQSNLLGQKIENLLRVL